MATLFYSAITSLDGYIADDAGHFEWAEPDEEVHGFINELERSIGTFLFGRRMYQVMAAWEDADAVPGQPPVMLDFARLWKGAQKVVYSRTLETVDTAATRIEREFSPDAVREMKASADRDLAIGGAALAAEAFRSHLIDECHLFVTPILVGGGTHAFPRGSRVSLELLDERRFGNGVIHLRYRITG